MCASQCLQSSLEMRAQCGYMVIGILELNGDAFGKFADILFLLSNIESSPLLPCPGKFDMGNDFGGPDCSSIRSYQ
jgi:hypothetical protein